MKSGGMFALVFIVLSLAGPDSGRPETVSQQVVARQQDMKAMSAAAKSLNAYFLGRASYNATAFRQEAETIARLAGDGLIGHFAGVVTAPGSKARPEIASERAKFERLAHDLRAYAEQVAASAQDGKTMPPSMRMRPAEMIEGGPFAKKRDKQPDLAAYSSEHAFHMMLQTCSTCHAAFRERQP